MDHSLIDEVDLMRENVGYTFITIDDRCNVLLMDRYGVVVVNDLFPNVDNRLVLFLEFILPRTVELRIFLTYHDDNRFYITKRIDPDEIQAMLAWN